MCLACGKPSHYATNCQNLQKIKANGRIKRHERSLCHKLGHAALEFRPRTKKPDFADDVETAMLASVQNELAELGMQQITKRITDAGCKSSVCNRR